MHYKHLKPWLAFGKFFYIFSWANLGGIVFGLVVADKFTGGWPFLPPQLLYMSGAGLGLGATWPVQGRPFYQLAWLWIGWATRRLLAPSTLEARSGDYFPLPAPTTGRSLTLDGTLTVPQTRTAGGSSLPPVELVPAWLAPGSTPAPKIASDASLAATVPVLAVPVGRATGTGSPEIAED